MLVASTSVGGFNYNLPPTALDEKCAVNPLLPTENRRTAAIGCRSPVAANEFRSGRACTARLGRSVAPGKRGYK